MHYELAQCPVKASTPIIATTGAQWNVDVQMSFDLDDNHPDANSAHVEPSIMQSKLCQFSYVLVYKLLEESCSFGL